MNKQTELLSINFNSNENCKLPQKEYGLKIDKKFINLNCKNEKESVQ